MRFSIQGGAVAISATALFAATTTSDAFSFVPTRTNSITASVPRKQQQYNTNNYNNVNGRRSTLVMKDENDSGSSSGSSSKFSLSNLFSSDGSSGSSKKSSSSLRGTLSSSSTVLEPHPSKRDHINPLNALYPPNRAALESVSDDDTTETSPPLPLHSSVVSGVLPNGFSYIFLPNRSPPGRFEAHLHSLVDPPMN